MESFWQNVHGSSLQQGDFLSDCPVPFITERLAENGVPQAFPVKIYDLIVMTQSCDLENPKGGFVALCPIYQIADYERVNEALAKKGNWEQVRKGRIEGLHLLGSQRDPANNRDALVVDFREIYSLPFVFLTNHAASLGDRWRLKSPYLEHFSQAFARFFMRVGLPSTIPSFK